MPTTTTTHTPAAQNLDANKCAAQPDQSQTRLEIYTDGAAIGNPGFGGYGAVIMRVGADGSILKTEPISGSDPDTTNNRMEMTAVCAALEFLGSVTSEPIEVFCDATLIPNTMNGWLAAWKAKGWKKSSGKEPANRDLWERLEAAAKGRNITWSWVRGHNGNPYNEEADRLAYAAARECENEAMTGH